MSTKLTRRELLREAACKGAGLALASGGAALCGLSGVTPVNAASKLKFYPARYYDKLSGKRVKCALCPKECVVGDRERGFCGVRENREGTYYTLVWGELAARNVDPIEKKPFFHFLPGTHAYSVATAGCNMDCKDCQNWDISQSRPEQIQNVYHEPPSDSVATAKRTGARSIAYTYSEPVVFYEYMLETAAEGRKRGVKSVMVSNGFIRKEPMTKLCQYLDAVKIDLKGFDEPFYKKYCVATLQPVLDTIKLVHSLGKWMEIVYLVVPTLNDKPGPIREMCRWLKKSVGADVPLHFSRFVPEYQLKNLPATPYSTLERCHKIAVEEGLRYVYIGNVPNNPAENTKCPHCQKVVVGRVGYRITRYGLKNGKCGDCGRTIAGVWG
ncbi:MAG: AmmeMemoRadiSam system radical SAM enzyme [Armatimonadota bacterium]